MAPPSDQASPCFIPSLLGSAGSKQGQCAEPPSTMKGLELIKVPGAALGMSALRVAIPSASIHSWYKRGLKRLCVLGRQWPFAWYLISPAPLSLPSVYMRVYLYHRDVWWYRVVQCYPYRSSDRQFILARLVPFSTDSEALRLI